MDDFTTFLALDAKHVEQLRLSYQTWKRFKPELLERPLRLICDALQGDEAYWRAETEFLGEWDRKIRLWDWPKGELEAEPLSQRERMLTAFVRLMWDCDTDYALKLDTDVIATAAGPWVPDFSTQAVIYAPRWGYTKPAEMIDALDDWGEGQSLLNPNPRQWTRLEGDRSFGRGAWRFHHRRVCSWLAFFERAFLFLSCALCPPPGRLPCPSQDTYHWYVAHRMGLPIEKYQPKRFGWRVINSTRVIRETVRQFGAQS